MPLEGLKRKKEWSRSTSEGKRKMRRCGEEAMGSKCKADGDDLTPTSPASPASEEKRKMRRCEGEGAMVSKCKADEDDLTPTSPASEVKRMKRTQEEKAHRKQKEGDRERKKDKGKSSKQEKGEEAHRTKQKEGNGKHAKIKRKRSKISCQPRKRSMKKRAKRLLQPRIQRRPRKKSKEMQLPILDPESVTQRGPCSPKTKTQRSAHKSFSGSGQREEEKGNRGEAKTSSHTCGKWCWRWRQLYWARWCR